MSIKRLFVGLWFPDEALKALSSYCGAMCSEKPYLRWTRAENLHITALFLGDVAEERDVDVSAAIGRMCAQTEPFSLVCRGASYAPRLLSPTMVWLSFQENKSFSAFAKRLAEETSAFVPNMDWNTRNASVPHITLARFRKAVLPTELGALRRAGLEGESIACSSCSLVESCLTASGPVYNVVREFRLTK